MVTSTPVFRVTLWRRDATLVVAKTATGDARVHLDHEARALGSLDHPGVVQLVATESRGDVGVVWTRWAGLHNLRSAPCAGVGDAIVVAGGILATVGHLHARGLTHGAITAEHVIVSPARTATLCSFRRLGAPGSTDFDSETSAAAALAIRVISTAMSSGTARPRRTELRMAQACLDVLADPRQPAADLAGSLARYLRDARQ